MPELRDMPLIPPFPFKSGPAEKTTADLPDNSPQTGDTLTRQSEVPLRRCNACDVLSLLSDFAGADMPGFAWKFLVGQSSHTCYEIAPAARAFITSNFPLCHLRGTVVDRRLRDLPSFGVLIAGFPCQPFSALGERGGLDERWGRGRLVDSTQAAIDCRRPLVFVLENVSGFASIDGGRAREHVIHFLADLAAYDLHEQLLCTSQHGLPQTRKRWYLVGVLREALELPFSWPHSFPMLSLAALLGPPPPGANPRRRPPVGQRSGRRWQRRVARW